MAFTLGTFMLTIILLLLFVAKFFTALDQMILISGSPITLTVLDLMCVSYLFYTLYDFFHWLAGWKPSDRAKNKKGSS